MALLFFGALVKAIAGRPKIVEADVPEAGVATPNIQVVVAT